MNISDSTVLITGAAGGLGRTMAEYLGSKGARLILTDYQSESLEALATTLQDQGCAVQAITADVTDEASVAALFEQAASGLGPVDVVVNNAGIVKDGFLVKARDGQVQSRMPLSDWEAVIRVNLTGVFLCGREAAAQMIEHDRRGVIINISSISRHGNMGQTNYTASKAGVAAMTVTWAKELARYGIRSVSISPGFVNTDLVAGMKASARDKIQSMIPAGRLASPQEIAHTVGFIIENDYISGRDLGIDGGLRL